MRHRSQFPRDRSTQSIGDSAFIGVNARLAPDQLPPGFVSSAINTRFNRGIAETRLGMVFLPWLNKVTLGTIVISSITRASQTATATTASNHGFATGSIAVISGATQTEYNGSFIVTVTGATTFTYTVTGSPATPATGSPVLNTHTIAPWGTVYGVGIFNDPRNFQDYLIIAADGNVYYTQVNNVAQAMTLPDGVTVTSEVTFTQAFDTLIMFRGFDLDQIQTTGVNQAWTGITQTVAGTGTQPIPRAKLASFFQNRLFIPTGADEIAASDFGDYTRYRPVAQELKINQGSSDKIVNIAKFNDYTIVIWKDRSIYALGDVYGDLTAARLDLITDQFGLLAAKSVAHCGSDILFLSQHGVMSIRQTEQNKLQSVTLPLSDPIQPIIDRINWNYAENAKGKYWNNRYYLAVPLDDAEEVGPELSSLGGQYLIGAGTYVVPTVTGATYRIAIGSDLPTVTNGSQTITASTDIVAQGSTITMTAASAAAIVTSVKRVRKGVNNAILVFDFLNKAWSGYDQAPDISIQDMFLFPYLGRDRLFIVTADGYIALYEEDYEDQLPVPYVDVAVSTVPANGNTIRVNGGTTVTVVAAASLNSGDNWGCNGSIALCGKNLFHDAIAPGYSNNYGGSPWTATNTTVTRPSSTSVRFYSSNGVLPTVSHTGTWATLTYRSTQPIEATIVTRGYISPEGDLSDFRWLAIDVQTWNPSFTLDLLTDGAEETFNQATDQTKDRTLWYKPFDKAAFDVTNADGRYMDKWREDYSLILNSATANGHAAECDIDETSGGIVVDQHQETREQFHVMPTGRSCRVKIVNAQGRIRTTGVKLEAMKELDNAITKA